MWHVPHKGCKAHFFEHEEGWCLCGQHRKGDREPWRGPEEGRAAGRACMAAYVKKYGRKPAEWS